MTNAVRMAPAAFRDKYITGVTTILLPENYPAVGPIWYNQNLNTSAHVHSVDMAANCGMQHPSCDGTTWSARIQTYYTASSTIAENIATGKTTGIETVIQWLRDDNSSGEPAVDSTASDGHRRNIMNASYKEMGNGYAYSSSRQWYYFWTQDFGGATGSSYKIPAGTCFSAPGNSSTLNFAANYYDKSGSAPSKAAVFIDDTELSMTLHLGTASAGTYIYSMSNDTKAHCFYFVFTDASGAEIRYPETTNLSTASDSACTGTQTIRRQLLYSQKALSAQTSSATYYYRINGERISAGVIGKITSGILLQQPQDLRVSPKAILMMK